MNCNDNNCDVRAFAQKLSKWLELRNWFCTTFGAVVWHKGEHHIAIDPAIDILGAFAAAEGVTADEIKVEVGAMK